MRVERRVAELRRDQLLQLLGEDMLEHFRLGVDFVPAHPQALDEKELEQPVVADDLEGDETSALGQAHTAVRLVLDQAERAELAQHPGDRCRGDVEPRGERVRRGGLLALLKHVDRLQVVLDGRGQVRVGWFKSAEFILSDRYILALKAVMAGEQKLTRRKALCVLGAPVIAGAAGAGLAIAAEPSADMQGMGHAQSQPAPPGMVWVPGGEFSMGATASSEGLCQLHGVTQDALPVHRVYVDGFWMDATEVTNEEFEKFAKATGYITIAERTPAR